jgi:sterol desaturase/sphingolipid hydroxylase (fatty acid hydroxylase superfamily)
MDLLFLSSIIDPIVDIYAREFEKPVPNPLIFGVPFFILFIAVEAIFIHNPRRGRNLYNWTDLKGSIGMGFGAVVIAPFTKTLFALVTCYLFLAFEPLRQSLFGYATIGGGTGFMPEDWVPESWFRTIELTGMSNFFSGGAFDWVSVWWVWAIVLVADDFNFYWHHRWSHTVRILWAGHVVHHSSKHFNLGSTAIRNGWFTLIYKGMFWMWMPIVGFHPVAIATALSINAIYQYCLHLKWLPSLGPLEFVFNTPWVHQVHHACNVEYMDKNHSGIFIFFDRLFGTFKQHEPNMVPEFGVTKPPKTNNPLDIFSHEFRDIWADVKAAPTWRAKFMYIFGPPGWSHDGSRMTAKQLQAALANKTLRLEDLPECLHDHFKTYHPELAKQPVAPAPAAQHAMAV